MFYENVLANFELFSYNVNVKKLLQNSAVFDYNIGGVCVYIFLAILVFVCISYIMIFLALYLTSRSGNGCPILSAISRRGIKMGLILVILVKLHKICV